MSAYVGIDKDIDVPITYILSEGFVGWRRGFEVFYGSQVEDCFKAKYWYKYSPFSIYVD